MNLIELSLPLELRVIKVLRKKGLRHNSPDYSIEDTIYRTCLSMKHMPPDDLDFNLMRCNRAVGFKLSRESYVHFGYYAMVFVGKYIFMYHPATKSGQWMSFRGFTEALELILEKRED